MFPLCRDAKVYFSKAALLSKSSVNIVVYIFLKRLFYIMKDKKTNRLVVLVLTSTCDTMVCRA